MNPQPVSYFAYLLRLWCEQRNGQTVWRASLESAQNEQQDGFASLDELFAFLEGRIEASGTDREVTSCEPISSQISEESEEE